jgi:hypothetical protein
MVESEPPSHNSNGAGGFIAVSLAALVILLLGLGFQLGLETAWNSSKPTVAEHREIERERAKHLAIRGTQKLEEYNAPCHPEQIDPYSDLCAQWRAAEGAQTSAKWTRLSVIFGLPLALLTLLAAAAAAFYAALAANESRRSASAAEQQVGLNSEIARIQLRAYVNCSADDLRRFPANDKIMRATYHASLTLKNYGQTPAGSLSVRWAASVSVDLLPGALEATKWFSITGLAPGDTLPVPARFSIPMVLEQNVASNKDRIYLDVEVQYVDVFNRRFHWVDHFHSAMGCELVLRSPRTTLAFEQAPDALGGV